MEFIESPKVKDIFNKYPKDVRHQLFYLRKLIISTSSEINGLHTLEETLKWGEPSYITKNGSTVRMDWKEKTPDQFALYFQCTSKLIPTFKKIYKNIFEFDGIRAIIFKVNSEIPEKEIKHCISMALTYHKIKHILLLGA